MGKAEFGLESMPSASKLGPYVALFVVSILLLKLIFGGPRKNLPPSPPGLPLIGHLHLLSTHKPVHQILADMAHKYGPLMYLKFGPVGTLIISSPKLAEECFKENDTVFAGRPFLTLITYLTYGGRDVVMARRPNSGWRDMRKLSVVELHNNKRLEVTHRLREIEVTYMVNSILHDAKTSKPSLLRQTLFRMTFNIISLMCVKKRYIKAESDPVDEYTEHSVEGMAFKETIDVCFILAGMICLQDCFPIVKYFKEEECFRRMKEVHRKLDKFFQRIVDEHKEKRENMKEELPDSEKDMVDVLLESKEQVTDIQIKATLLNAYLGATETLILTMEWAMTEVIRNPQIRQRAQQEMDREVGRNRICKESDMPKLRYICAIISETFRLHPPAPVLVPRETTADCKIAGYDVPANTRVMANTWAWGRDPRNWDNPLEFNPDRFMDKAENVGDEYRGRDFRLIPFGAGRRICPGINLGLNVVHTAIANLVHGFDWTATEKDLDITEAVGLSNPKLIPLRATATPRLSEEVYMKAL